ncbi:hypothetical protein [Nesterenkonia alba]|uniref:hypothetical protein n=1 Tax=Nesterenkonia alba TaxID=515814 RepID=UPI0012EC0DCE|nr:hypothetical protein [Nesterenkonia alba]
MKTASILGITALLFGALLAAVFIVDSVTPDTNGWGVSCREDHDTQIMVEQGMAESNCEQEAPDHNRALVIDNE